MASTEIQNIFAELGLTPPADVGEGGLVIQDPSNGQTLARLATHDEDAALAMVGKAQAAFKKLRNMPGPKRGELVRQMGEMLRTHKEGLSKLVCAEVGKGIEEARGEVQEMIDICDFATGLSRTLGGRTLMSERDGHRMMELWQPLGVVLCISAFNFPVAVWSWNAAIAFVCGDSVVWKPSPKAALCGIAVHELLKPVLEKAGHGDAMQLVLERDVKVAEALVDDARIPLVSATGSCAMGRKVYPRVASRLARCLLELGGNNAIIVDKSANLDLAAHAIAFGAAGTAGQRCTSTRRVFVEAAVADALMAKLEPAYRQLSERIGDPRDSANLIGPLIDEAAVQAFSSAVERAAAAGGDVRVGGKALEQDGNFVQPTLVRVPDGKPFPLMAEETFAPILYVQAFPDGNLDEAIASQNSVEQGLSSALFTDSVRAVERFYSPDGSDCGIANVNLGTSGAEIGGAFGGEKETGGGREAGSDAWKSYMRRQTCTINGSDALPLAQGIKWE
ncbi:MAG: aldehyde dehydrogenase family protein [Nannocystales bacterium]